MVKLAKGAATALIVAGFGAMIYIFVIQTRYLQPDYRVPHPEFGRTVPFIFKGAVRYLTRDGKLIFQCGFSIGLAMAAMGAYWRRGIERRAYWTRELLIVAAFLYSHS